MQEEIFTKIPESLLTGNPEDTDVIDGYVLISGPDVCPVDPAEAAQCDSCQ